MIASGIADRTDNGYLRAARQNAAAGAGAPRYPGGLGAKAGAGVSIGAENGPIQPRDEYIPSMPGQNYAAYPIAAPDEGGTGAGNAGNAGTTGDTDNPDDTDNPNGADTPDDNGADGIGAGEEYSPEEQQVIADLEARDREVRAHEQAHVSAGGAYIRGGASYDYQSGPDGKRYAVGGEVSIDTSPVRDNPQATMAKMQVVRAAALAPADPSAQDRAVAAAAAREEANASAELNEMRAAEAASAYTTSNYTEQAQRVIDLVA